MTKYEWVYLCSDPRRLRLTLKFLPKTMVGLQRMVVGYLSHSDPPFHAAQLDATLRECAPLWLAWNVVDLSAIHTLCPATLRAYFFSTKPRWGLGVKLLIPCVSAQFTTPFPLLYTDDDMIVCQDPAPLFDEGQMGPLELGPSFASGGNFPFFKQREEKRFIADQLGEAMQISDVFERYDKRILDAGFFYLSPSDLADWPERLARFAALPYIQDLDPAGHEFRRLDQRFLTAFGLRRGVRRLGTASQRRNFLTPPPKNLRSAISNTYFVHYMSRQYKAAWMTALEGLAAPQFAERWQASTHGEEQ